MSRNDNGNVYGILSLLLTLVIIGVVGFPAGKSYMSHKTDDSAVKARADSTANDKASIATYKSNGYSFEYPATEWVPSTTANNSNYYHELTIQTDDYESNIGVGVKTGAIIAVAVIGTSDVTLEGRISNYRTYTILYDEADGQKGARNTYDSVVASFKLDA